MGIDEHVEKVGAVVAGAGNGLQHVVRRLEAGFVIEAANGPGDEFLRGNGADTAE